MPIYFLFAGVGWKGLLRILRNGNFHKGYGNPLRKDFRWRNACTVGFDGKSIAPALQVGKVRTLCVRENQPCKGIDRPGIAAVGSFDS